MPLMHDDDGDTMIVTVTIAYKQARDQTDILNANICKTRLVEEQEEATETKSHGRHSLEPRTSTADQDLCLAGLITCQLGQDKRDIEACASTAKLWPKSPQPWSARAWRMHSSGPGRADVMRAPALEC